MGGYYLPHFAYYPEKFGGLSAKRFCEALTAEFSGTFGAWEGANFCLHTHKFFKTFDLTGSGKPTRIAYNDRDVREDDDKCKPSESISCFSVPWFIHYDKEWIEKYASIFRKVILNHEQLLESDTDKSQGGRWYGTTNA